MTFFVPPSQPNGTLGQYLLSVRRLLHDATGNYWSDQELTDYINEARRRTVADTGCNRVLQSVTLNQGQEVYPYSSLPQGASTIDVLNITLLWGNLRVPMNYMVYTEFNLKMRSWQNFQSRPITFTVYGQGSVYVGPLPDQAYTSEWDTVVMPQNLVASADVDTIVFPFTAPITFYAAYLAKYKEQSYDEADRFEKEYLRRAQAAVRSSFTRRITKQFPT